MVSFLSGFTQHFLSGILSILATPLGFVALATTVGFYLFHLS